MSCPARKNDDNNMVDGNRGSHGSCLGLLCMNSAAIGRVSAPVGPPAPILTNSDHPPISEWFLIARVVFRVFPVFFRGGKSAMPAQWRKQGALEVVENGLENE